MEKNFFFIRILSASLGRDSVGASVQIYKRDKSHRILDARRHGPRSKRRNSIPVTDCKTNALSKAGVRTTLSVMPKFPGTRRTKLSRNSIRLRSAVQFASSCERRLALMHLGREPRKISTIRSTNREERAARRDARASFLPVVIRRRRRRRIVEKPKLGRVPRRKKLPHRYETSSHHSFRPPDNSVTMRTTGITVPLQFPARPPARPPAEGYCSGLGKYVPGRITLSAL